MSEQIKKGVSPNFFFLSLGVMVTLITSVIAGLSLFFETLSHKMPDVLNSYYEYGYSSYTYESMRTMIAILLIFFPIFLILSYFWWKYIKKGFESKNEKLFKWIMYIILFLASLVIVIDLVILVNYFVAGEITNRFIYKVLGTALIAGMIWVYYYLSLKDFNISKSKNIIVKRILSNISIIMFISLIIFGFMVMGSPKMQRAWRLDERRESDLQSIQWQIVNYWQQRGKMPISLNDLKDPISGNYTPQDPEFQQGKIYEYIFKENTSFILCATFSEVSQQGLIENNNSAVIDNVKSTSNYISEGSNSWNHGKGRVCFDRTIDPKIYKPNNP